jgi:hypothetical protein
LEPNKFSVKGACTKWQEIYEVFAARRRVSQAKERLLSFDNTLHHNIVIDNIQAVLNSD